MLKKVGVVVLLFAVLTGAGYADDISDQIDSAKKLYEEKKYSQSVQELQFAINQIQQLQIEQLKGVFPDPLNGWEAEEPEGTAAGMAFLGGGIAVNRSYFKGETGESIEIQVLTDSPLLQSVLIFLQNPALLASEPGSKLIKVQGKNAVLKFSSEDKEGELSFIVGTRTLITLNGTEIADSSVILEYAEKINLDKIKQITGE